MNLARLKKALFGIRPPIPEVLSEFTGLQRIFRAPPFTDEYLAAILRIAPNCRGYKPSEKYRDLWEQYQNAASWGEFLALERLFRAIPRPGKVLEIGPGLGRSLVFFTRKLGWQDAEIHAYEGNGSETKYTKLGPRFEDSFCGNIPLLRQTLRYNGIGNVTVHDAKATPLRAMPGPFDIVYSFYSIGFHWSVEHFLDDLSPLLGETGVGIFTVPPSFVPGTREGGMFHAVLPLYPNAAKANRRDNLLVLSRSPLPSDVGVG